MDPDQASGVAMKRSRPTPVGPEGEGGGVTTAVEDPPGGDDRDGFATASAT